MAQTARNPSFPVAAERKTHRPRLAPLALVAAGVLLMVLAIQSLDWQESPAMALGELFGLIAPPAAIALAGLALYALWNRARAR